MQIDNDLVLSLVSDNIALDFETQVSLRCVSKFLSQFWIPDSVKVRRSRKKRDRERLQKHEQNWNLKQIFTFTEFKNLGLNPFQEFDPNKLFVDGRWDICLYDGYYLPVMLPKQKSPFYIPIALYKNGLKKVVLTLNHLKTKGIVPIKMESVSKLSDYAKRYYSLPFFCTNKKNLALIS